MNSIMKKELSAKWRCWFILLSKTLLLFWATKKILFRHRHSCLHFKKLSIIVSLKSFTKAKLSKMERRTLNYCLQHFWHTELQIPKQTFIREHAGRKRSIEKDHSWQFGWFPLFNLSTNCIFNLKTLNGMGWNTFSSMYLLFWSTLQYNLVANLILECVMVPFKSHKSGKEGFNQYIPERNGGQWTCSST